MMYVAAQALFIGSGCIALAVVGTMLAEYSDRIVAALNLEPMPRHWTEAVLRKDAP